MYFYKNSTRQAECQRTKLMVQHLFKQWPDSPGHQAIVQNII